MELLFRNKRRTAKLCMKVNCENIYHLSDTEINKLNEILDLNNGYSWEPVRTGFACENKLPLIAV